MHEIAVSRRRAVYKTSGIKKWGANISIGHPMALGVIKGKQEQYLSENPLCDVQVARTLTR